MQIVLAVILYGLGIVFGYDALPSVIAWGIPSTLLVLGVVCLEAQQGTSAAVRRIGWLGDSSYALYLIHILVITLALKLADFYQPLLAMEPALVAFLLAPVCVLIAEILHRGLERPLLQVLNPRRALVPPHQAGHGDHRLDRKPKEFV